MTKAPTPPSHKPRTKHCFVVTLSAIGVLALGFITVFEIIPRIPTGDYITVGRFSNPRDNAESLRKCFDRTRIAYEINGDEIRIRKSLERLFVERCT
ncbi:hypothetical protein HG434_001235 [Candidatus Saccharibacteria bacterium]|nr:hypothetical protein [Candidatus Saccharibacteria bacterium]